MQTIVDEMSAIQLYFPGADEPIFDVHKDIDQDTVGSESIASFITADESSQGGYFTPPEDEIQFNLPDMHPNSLLHAPEALLNPRGGNYEGHDTVDGFSGHNYQQHGGHHYLPTSHNLGTF